jgi:hypothetical protein
MEAAGPRRRAWTGRRTGDGQPALPRGALGCGTVEGDDAGPERLGAGGALQPFDGRTLVPTAGSGLTTVQGDVDCRDFTCQQEAQQFFLANGGSPMNDPFDLDRDHDGRACEDLPPC